MNAQSSRARGHRPDNCIFVGQSETKYGLRYEFSVASESDPGKLHRFVVSDDGSRPACSCTAARFRKEGCYLVQHADDVLLSWFARSIQDAPDGYLYMLLCEIRTSTLPENGMQAKTRDVLDTEMARRHRVAA